MFKLMYVFDPREATGYVCQVPEFLVCRVPEFLAWVIVRVVRRLDYAPTESGY